MTNHTLRFATVLLVAGFPLALACGSAATGDDAVDGDVPTDIEPDGEGGADGDGDVAADADADGEETDGPAGRCGDNVVQPERGEVCDDGNTTGGDGCSADCTSDETCGNGIVDPGEACDGETWCDELCRDTRVLDSDHDTIRDLDEGPATTDTDGDTTPDFQDTDSDGDGILDAAEAGDMEVSTPPVDTDHDTTPDFRDTDSDGDGIPDAVELAGDPDGDTVPSFRDTDSDGDGIPDAVEAGADPTHPVNTDGDPQPDYLDTDSDGDAISDAVEGTADPDGDTLPNYVDTDADGDTIPDATEGTADLDGDLQPNFLDLDADGDGLRDELEVFCPALSRHSSQFPDTDGDGFSDLAEHAVGSDLCDPTSGVLDVVDFYFELPHGAPERTDTLYFYPQVRRTDVFFSMDTTGSMSGAVTNLRSGLSGIMAETRGRVADAAFGVGQWEDFPVGFFGSFGDLPWRLLRSMTTDSAAAQLGVNALTLHGGSDYAEAGYEALYQLATGDGISWTPVTAGSVPPYTGAGNGGVGFRDGTLPIVLHITDATSHEASEYIAAGITQAHSKAQAFAVLQALGARVVSINNAWDNTNVAQLSEISSTTGAVVPVCAFRTGAATWRCGTSQCCTGLAGAGVAPVGGRCTLQYRINTDGSGLGAAVVDGIDALVKYTTFDVYTRVRDDGSVATPDTSCFVKSVQALLYVAPPAEPESTCTPAATPAAFLGAIYNNGFRGVATGTSSSTRPGIQLHFTVHAENDSCAFPAFEAQLFTAFIDVVDVTTGQVLDTQEATIIVPPRIL